ncbi:MAG: ribose 5-phosphate isomerase B [Candidatus Omnitrophica bacterium]|nr:ribose 5-phosphate isomerase B [Candidatus Omnitrophota bacterium]
MAKRIGVASDHGGVNLKRALVGELSQKGCEVTDLGTESELSCDYPDFAFPLAEGVASGKFDRGILICRSGIGMSICANKVKGVRAALCLTEEQAKLSRLHNDANVLCLSESFTGAKDAKEIVRLWLATEFEGERHERRLNKIKDYEKNH